MGRHGVFDDLVGNAPDAPRPGRPQVRTGLIAILATVLLVAAAGTAAIMIGPRQLLDRIPLTAAKSCTGTAIRLIVTPAAAGAVRRILEPLAAPADGCVATSVQAQEAAETVAGSAVLPLDRAPDLWIPDSSVWSGRASRWPAVKVGSIGLSPVVLATSKRVVARRNWAGNPPSWQQAFASGQPVTLPSAAEHVESLLTLTALWQSLGRGRPAEQALTGAVLIAARNGALAPTAALDQAQADSDNSPLVPASEQSVAAVNRSLTGPGLTAVYPTDGSPMLDYPVLRITPKVSNAVPVGSRSAVDAVIARLGSAAAISQLSAAGFRQSSASGPRGAGLEAGPVRALPAQSAADLRTVLGRVSALARPSRLLALLDVSASMSAQLPSGVTRVELATAAAVQGIDLLPDQASAGVWVFASGVDGPNDFLELTPTEALGTVGSGGSHRDQVVRAAGSAAGRLKSGGTPLYDTVLAAVRSLRRSYDPRSVNFVVVFTDGANEKSTGLTLPRLLRTLADEADPAQPVAVYGIGIGPDIDLSGLEQIAAATQGRAYRVDSAEGIRAALLDGLSSRAQAQAG